VATGCGALDHREVTRSHGGSKDADPAVAERIEDARARIAAVVKRRRADLELTQEQVAEALGCTTSHYQRVEYAEVSVSLAFLAHLTVVLECELEDMLQPLDRFRRRVRSTKKAAN